MNMLLTREVYEAMGYASIPATFFARYKAMAEQTAQKCTQGRLMLPNITGTNKRGLCELADLLYMGNTFVRVKVAVIAAFTALVSWLGALAVPFGLLVLCNVIDYITGMIAAPKRGHARSNDRGMAGIIKKVCFWLWVGVGMVVDTILHYLTDTMGWTIPFSFMVATLVCIWLLANELLPIIENISDITGGQVAPFLKPIVSWVKGQAKEKGKMPGEDEEEG